jgi:tRNA uridine 5-carboxymethylaminomethyl modification enzyme
VLERQKNTRLDYLFEFDSVPVQEKIPCYIALTNNNTHEIIKKNLRLSALYSGNIKGIGPRYCPSIEDKVGRFAHQESHHIFVEPEGEFSDDVYPAGISTSLPLSVQNEYIRSIKGFENAQITKCGYAIEYDFFQPINLKHTLESKKVKGLFLAGQINGTTGYEEAAGQGLIAGINAILCLNKKDPFVLNRTESYIGVMIDDLVTLGADEPYRMFTSRAERRLLLRQDNVFYRLGDYGKKFGLVSDELYKKYCEERDLVNYCVDKARAQENSELYDLLHSVEFTPDVQEKCKVLLGVPQISSRVLLSVYANIRYAGYLEKERKEIEKTEKFQALEIPDTLDYKNMSGLTVELQQKLLYYKPKTIAQAQLIPGMTPAAVSILIFQVRMREKGNNTGL